MFDVLIVRTEIAESLDQFFTVVFLLIPVETLQLCMDVAFRGQENLRAESCSQADGVLCFDIERIGHHESQHIVFKVGGNDVKRTQESKRQAVGFDGDCRIFASENEHLELIAEYG